MARRFAASERFAERAIAAFRHHERRIREHLPAADVRHRGGTSVRGALTSGDVDVHVRVAAEAFASAFDVLASLYEPFHQDAWTAAESAFFVAPRREPAVEVALTVVGTVDDFHHGAAWDRIAADPQLLGRYNELKRRCQGVSETEYDAAKRAFFHESF